MTLARPLHYALVQAPRQALRANTEKEITMSVPKKSLLAKKSAATKAIVAKKSPSIRPAVQPAVQPAITPAVTPAIRTAVTTAVKA